MNLLVFCLGITIPIILGWLALIVIEHHSPVLGRAERWFFALILGPTLFALIVFASHIVGLTNLTLAGFLLPSGIVLILLFMIAKKTGALASNPSEISYAPSLTLPRYRTIGIVLLSVWTALKLMAGAYDLVNVPTYWDDSFNNWNMRGKMFFQHQKIILEIPIGNGVVQSSGGVGSYPPTVSLLKAWLSILRGSWQEPLVNSLHLVWITGLLGVFYFALRRKLSPLLSLFGVYLLTSLPLLLIQAMNPYADVFMAAHVLLPVLCLYFGAQEKNPAAYQTWIKIFGLTLGLLIFTKNEASANSKKTSKNYGLR